MEIPENILKVYYIAVIVSALIMIVEGYGMLYSPSALFLLGVRIKTIHGIIILIIIRFGLTRL